MLPAHILSTEFAHTPSRRDVVEKYSRHNVLGCDTLRWAYHVVLQRNNGHPDLSRAAGVIDGVVIGPLLRRTCLLAGRVNPTQAQSNMCGAIRRAITCSREGAGMRQLSAVGMGWLHRAAGLWAGPVRCLHVSRPLPGPRSGQHGPPTGTDLADPPPVGMLIAVAAAYIPRGPGGGPDATRAAQGTLPARPPRQSARFATPVGPLMSAGALMLRRDRNEPCPISGNRI